MDSKLFLDAIDEIVAQKGIKKEVVLEALQAAMERAYLKQIGFDDAKVSVTIDAERGAIDMYQIKIVVPEVEDDVLEISLEEANADKKGKKYKYGDEFFIEATADDFRKAAATAAKLGLRQKLAEAEKEVLYELYKDKVGQMIIGKVEKVEENGIAVSIASGVSEKNSIFVPKKELIGDELFKTGDKVKLYVSDVTNGTKGARILLSRASEGFLKKLFEEEIREVEDGTVIVKNVSRKAGERSKVAVYSLDPNIDPAGTCIGPMGSRIQKVVSQLGSNQNKEKIDIIAYSTNDALFVMESLKPAKVLGIKYDLNEKSATVVVNNDALSLAIGRHGVNVSLAARLTGYHIDVRTLDQATEEGLDYQSYEEIEKLANAAKAKISSQVKKDDIISSLPEGYVAPTARVYDDEKVNAISDDERMSLEAEIDEEEISSLVEEATNEVIEDTPKTEEVKEEKKAVEVKTTTTLESLEKALESESKKDNNYKKFTNKKKVEKKEEEKPAAPTVDASAPRMAIYTDEELKAMENEKVEEEVYDDNVDYDEFDEYYDDEK